MKYRLGDVLTIKHGFPFKGEFFSDDGQFIVLTPANFYEKGGFKYTPGKEKYYTHTFPDEYLCNQGDLIVVMTQQAEGLLGSTAFVPEGNRYLHNQRIGLINTNEEVLLPAYADYLFRTKSVREQIRNSASGTKVKHTSPEKIYDVVVDLPTVEIQRLVSNCLSMLEERIKLNQTVCSDLESMAKLLYDYWFVQFDFPDENGKPYKSSGGIMVWNEELKREIPEGWEVKTISDIASLRQEVVFPKCGVKYSHYSIPAFDNNRLPACEDGEDIASNKFLVPDNCVLVSKLNPQFKRIWLTGDPKDNSICSTEYLPIVAEKVGINFLYEVFNSDAYSVHLRQKASSSTGSRKRIDPENCMSFHLAFNEDLSKRYDNSIASMIQQANCALVENQQLANLRDFLLPMLMNGQVTVGDKK